MLAGTKVLRVLGAENPNAGSALTSSKITRAAHWKHRSIQHQPTRWNSRHFTHRIFVVLPWGWTPSTPILQKFRPPLSASDNVQRSGHLVSRAATQGTIASGHGNYWHMQHTGKRDLWAITSPKHSASYQLSCWIRHFFILLSQLDPTLSLRLQPTTNQDLDEPLWATSAKHLVMGTWVAMIAQDLQLCGPEASESLKTALWTSSWKRQCCETQPKANVNRISGKMYVGVSSITTSRVWFKSTSILKTCSEVEYICIYFRVCINCHSSSCFIFIVALPGLFSSVVSNHWDIFCSNGFSWSCCSHGSYQLCKTVHGPKNRVHGECMIHGAYPHFSKINPLLEQHEPC